MTATRDIMARAMAESQLQTHVISSARTLGWRVVHFRPAMTTKGWRTAYEGDSGFTDLVLARNGRVLCVELKTEKGKPDDNQKLWAQEMGESYRLWRPSDWLSGAIERELI